MSTLVGSAAYSELMSDSPTCACGCGSPVSVAKWDNRPQGIKAGETRAFAHGHNQRKPRLDPPNPSGLCMCGCGQQTTIAVKTNRALGVVAGEYCMYLKGHKVKPGIHRLISKDISLGLGHCVECGPNTVITESGKDRWRCRQGKREWNFQKKYKISYADYEQMLEDQNYLCAVCGVVKHTEDKPLFVDHCHETGAVAGLLCSPCNVAAGMLKEDPETVKRLLVYVTRKKAIQ